MLKVTREFIVGLDLWKQRPDLLPNDPLLAAIEVASVLCNASENLIRLADTPSAKLRGKHLRHCLTLVLPELIDLLNLMEQRLNAGDGWNQLALLYDSNGVEFQGRHAGSFALVAFDYAYELSASFADEERTTDGDLRLIVDIDSCVTEWNRIRQRIQAMPRIDLPQLRVRVDVEKTKLGAKLRRPVPPDDSPKWDSYTEARNKWLYEQCHKGTKYGMILTVLKSKSAKWEPIESVNGIKKAASTYATRKQLKPIPRRGAGRPKQK